MFKGAKAGELPAKQPTKLNRKIGITYLPDNQFSMLLTVIDSIEELVRLGLRKGIWMKEDGKICAMLSIERPPIFEPNRQAIARVSAIM
jgi:hypothetical protein